MLADRLADDGVRDDSDGVVTPAARVRARTEPFAAWAATIDADLDRPLGRHPGTLAGLQHRDRSAVHRVVVPPSGSDRTVLTAVRRSGQSPVMEEHITTLEQQLTGSPDPAMCVPAAAEFGGEASRPVVAHGVASGVAAHAAGGFGPMVDIDRGGNGARRVVRTHLVADPGPVPGPEAAR